MEEFFISHSRKEADGTYLHQSNEEHSLGVAALAETFAQEFGFGAWGRVLGLLHDKGKETKEFQAHILRATGEDVRANDANYEGHAYVGGLMAFRDCGAFGALLGNPIFGHHAGLYNDCEIKKFLADKTIPQGVKPLGTIPQLSIPFKIEQAEDFHHLERMLYSCLVDADYLDTERFMDQNAYVSRGSASTLQQLLPKLETKLASFQQVGAMNKVQEVRNYVQQQCREMSQGERGIFSLTVPTGGGKTLSSLLWAMLHAIKNGQKRIIIAIPYTSIIVQTASILKEIFGEENVLEHHSNFNVLEDLKDDSLRSRVELATENWDYPIIVTTNVQLFESMFSNRSSDCRKLHNIVNSVLILDEVQMLPTEFLAPIVDSLKSYQRMFGVSILLTTASQPALEGERIQGVSPKVFFQGFQQVTPIIPNEECLHEKLRRVSLDIDETPRSYDDVAQMLLKHEKVLCIVNTRRDAKEIFERLPKEGVTLHLSRMMCPLHVNQTIKRIKDALKDDTVKIIRVVATQLVEAGVDIDFPVVYRQQTGLDSLLQAAGRCNREGRLPVATTYSFALDRHLPPGLMTRANDARKNLDGKSDWFAPDTMTDYFRQFFARVDCFDKPDIRSLLYKPTEMMFKEAAEKFHLIEDDTTSLIVNWSESMDLVAQLKDRGPNYAMLKKLSQYSVNVRKGDLKKLLDIGAVDSAIDGFYIVTERVQYDDKLGLLTDNHWLEEILIL